MKRMQNGRNNQLIKLYINLFSGFNCIEIIPVIFLKILDSKRRLQNFNIFVLVEERDNWSKNDSPKNDCPKNYPNFFCNWSKTELTLCNIFDHSLYLLQLYLLSDHRHKSYIMHLSFGLG
jgi:hypothetical protein